METQDNAINRVCIITFILMPKQRIKNISKGLEPNPGLLNNELCERPHTKLDHGSSGMCSIVSLVALNFLGLVRVVSTMSPTSAI